MAIAKRNVARAVVALEQSFDQARFDRSVEIAAATGKYRLEILNGGALGEDLVLNAAQKRFIDEFCWPNVGGEDNHGHERDLELQSALQRQEVHPALERDDPTVQQLARGALLPPEVIDHQHAAIRHSLDGGTVEPCSRAVA